MGNPEITPEFIQQSPEKAFNQLVDLYSEKVYWHVKRMVNNHEDANDLVQEVFVKVWKNLARYRGDSQLYTWVYRIATNECITFFNKQKKIRKMSFDDEESGLADQLASSESVDGKAAEKKLHSAISTLPEKQRLVFNMRYYDEMPYDKMSGILGTSVGGLKASYHHAVQKIQKFIESHD